MIYYGKTDCGLVRSENQDTFGFEEIKLRCIGKSALLAVVCDGMGGVAGGKLASTSACDCFIKYVARQIEAFDQDLSNPSNIPFEKILRDGVKVANKTILATSMQNTEYKGMGTTLVAVLCVDDAMYGVNIGDSRIYGLYKGELVQLSHDHSYVQTLIDEGKITEMDAASHPEKNVILKAVGVNAVAEPDIFSFDVPEAILLCSDGLSNVVPENHITMLLSQKKPLCDVVDSLIKAANDAGAPDNITASVILPLESEN